MSYFLVRNIFEKFLNWANFYELFEISDIIFEAFILMSAAVLSDKVPRRAEKLNRNEVKTFSGPEF